MLQELGILDFFPPDQAANSEGCYWKVYRYALLSGVDLWGRKCVKSAAVLVASPRVFPLSVRAIFTREIQIFTHKFTPLSKSWTCFAKQHPGKTRQKFLAT